MVPNHDVGDKPQGWATAPKAHRPTPVSYNDGDPLSVPSMKEIFMWCGSFAILNTIPRWKPNNGSGSNKIWRTPKRKGSAFRLHSLPPISVLSDRSGTLRQPGGARDIGCWTVGGPQVEALFCGHVHHFFWNRYREMDIYLVPATSFIRPEYSELCTIAPRAENGRDDQEKLGFSCACR